MLGQLRKGFTTVLGGLALGVVCVACGPKAPQTPKVPPAPQAEPTSRDPEAIAKHADAPGIAWYEGDVESAFANAKAQNKPVFLYWGAQWCPPCQQLKSSVFTRPDFIEKSKLFVPVYLDGDNQGAQKWGEKFRVVGYPTVVIFSPEGKEVMRLSSAMDLRQYASVLDDALADQEPAHETLAKVKNAAGPISADDCRRLAYNGWIYEDVAPGTEATLADDLSIAAQKCPSHMKIERARLVMNAAGFSPTEERVRRVEAMLAEGPRAAGTSDTFSALKPEFFDTAKRLGPDFTAKLLREWNTYMDRVIGDSDLAPGSQLFGVAMMIIGTKGLSEDGKVPPAMEQDARNKTLARLSETKDPYVRAGVVNSAHWVYDELGDKQAARQMLEGELSKSKTRYYYLGDIAKLDEDLGRKKDALEGYAKAYEESKGAATRFQWGETYLQALIRLSPNDEKRIREVGIEVLGELDGPDRVHARTRTRLNSLDKALREWSAKGKHAEVLAALRGRMKSVCERVPEDDPGRASCTGFLA